MFIFFSKPPTVHPAQKQLSTYGEDSLTCSDSQTCYILSPVGSIIY